MPIEWTDLRTILPAVILIAGALLVVSFDLLRKRGMPREALEYAAYATLASALGWTLYLLGSTPSSDVPDAFALAVRRDGLALFMTVTILAGTALSLFLVPALTMRGGNVLLSEAFALVLCASAGMILLVMSRELVTLFLALELMSISVYILTGLTRDRPESNEASMKYFVIGSVASAILLYGFALLYGATGRLDLEGIAAGLKAGGLTPVALAGITLSMIGFAFKIGAVPFHVWLPDAYEGAPTPVTAYMAVTVKAAGFGVLLRFILEGIPAAGPVVLEAVAAIAVVTMLLGNLVAVVQTSVKRMLAYSSIAHSGYLLIGVAAALNAGSGAAEAVAATAFYLFAYSFMTLGAFAVLAFAGRGGGEAETYEELEGLARRRPWTAFFMAAFMVSLAGLPPTGGFFGKLMVFKAALAAPPEAAPLVWLVVAGVVTSVVSLSYYMRVVVAMYLKPGLERGEGPEGAPDMGVAAAVVVAGVFTIGLGLLPGSYLQMALTLAMRWV